MSRLEPVDLTQQTVTVESEQGKKESHTKRNAQLADELPFLLFEGCDTLQASFKRALRDYGDRNCIGAREWRKKQLRKVYLDQLPHI